MTSAKVAYVFFRGDTKLATHIYEIEHEDYALDQATDYARTRKDVPVDVYRRDARGNLTHVTQVVVFSAKGAVTR